MRETKQLPVLLTSSMGLGVPGLSVLSDLESPTLSEKLPDLFLAALMGTLRELLRDSKEDISSFTLRVPGWTILYHPNVEMMRLSLRSDPGGWVHVR